MKNSMTMIDQDVTRPGFYPLWILNQFINTSGDQNKLIIRVLNFKIFDELKLIKVNMLCVYDFNFIFLSSLLYF